MKTLGTCWFSALYLRCGEHSGLHQDRRGRNLGTEFDRMDLVEGAPRPRQSVQTPTLRDRGGV